MSNSSVKVDLCKHTYPFCWYSLIMYVFSGNALSATNAYGHRIFVPMRGVAEGMFRLPLSS